MRHSSIRSRILPPYGCSGSETVIFIRDFEYGSLGFGVLELLRQLARLLRSKLPVDWIIQKQGHWKGCPSAPQRGGAIGMM